MPVHLFRGDGSYRDVRRQPQGFGERVAEHTTRENEGGRHIRDHGPGRVGPGHVYEPAHGQEQYELYRNQVQEIGAYEVVAFAALQK